MTACQEAMDRNTMVTAQALGTTEKSASEAPAQTSNCPSLLLPFPRFETTEESKRRSSPWAPTRSKTPVREISTHKLKHQALLDEREKRQDSRKKRKKCSRETWSSTGWTHLAGKDPNA